MNMSVISAPLLLDQVRELLPSRPIGGFNCDTVIAEFLRSRVDAIDLQIFTDVSMRLPVEDDAQFIAEELNYLDDALRSTNEIAHTLYLADGYLRFDYEVCGDVARVAVLYCHVGDTRFSERRRVTLARKALLGAWGRVAEALRQVLARA